MKINPARLVAFGFLLIVVSAVVVWYDPWGKFALMISSLALLVMGATMALGATIEWIVDGWND